MTGTDVADVLTDHPGRAVLDKLLDEQRANALKQASAAISEALDWSQVARRPSHAEVERRRAEPGPLARTVDREAAARWAAGEA